jgi:adenylate kinase family enzyme
MVKNLSLKSDKQLLDIALDAEREMFEKLEAVGKGKSAGLIISGPPGSGKSYTSEQFLIGLPGLSHIEDVKFERDIDKDSPTFKQWIETERIKKTGPLVRKSRYASWSLVRDLYRNRNSGNIIIIDDNDIALQDLDFVGLIMAATEQNAVRKIDYNLKAIEELRMEQVPNKFEYDGGIIILTNYNMRDVPKQGEKGAKKYHERWRALISRLGGQYIDLELSNARALMIFLEHRIRTTGQITKSAWLKKYYGTFGISKLQQEEVFDFVRLIMEKEALVHDLDLRVYNQIAGYVITYGGNNKKWKDRTVRDLCHKGTVL